MVAQLERQLRTERLMLRPMSLASFDIFVRDMLTDPKVVEHYHGYRGLFDLQQIRVQAARDFWEHFELSRAETPFEIFSIFEGSDTPAQEAFVGWAGLLQSSLSDEYGGPELQFMIASHAFGKGYATEASMAVIDEARERKLTSKIIATVDIPNSGSIRVLEKLQFEFVGQIEAYGSRDMYLYTYALS
jgi:ribosomal-protein-alanine N-acetyltransferase